MSRKLFYSLIITLIGAIIICLGMLYNQYIPKNSPTQLLSERQIHIQKNKCEDISKSPINIVLITDSRYVTPTRVTMLSAIKNKCPESLYHFYIITENITKKDTEDLLRLKEISPKTIEINILQQQEPDLPYENMQRFLQYKVGMHKIYLPQVLPTLDKVIYMDSDIIVLKDLQELFAQDVEGLYATVAKDGIYYRFPKEMAEMGLDKRGFYFNSGVMLYNLEQQRKDNIVSKLVDYINTHTDFFGDQDVLNVVFGDKLKLMSYRYNCISTFFEADDLNFLSEYFGEYLPKDTFDIYENATIIHYAGDKPWQENYKPQYLKELWFRYYNEIRDL